MSYATSSQAGTPASSAAPPSESQLTEQLKQKKAALIEQSKLQQHVTETSTSSRSPLKLRSLSDGSSRTPSSASPNPLNLQRTKDDSAVAAPPATPQRPDRPVHGLSLQMPPRMFGSPVAGGARAPLSPKLDPSHIYGSPASVLPRRSRGLDFSRACTNLHHSTLAESSPDSSPVVVGRGVAIPHRRSTINSTSMGSPNMSGGAWQSSGHADRNVISSSVSSVNMFDSDTTSSSDEDDDESMHMIEKDDPILTTPQISRPGNAFPFSPSTAQSPGGDWMGGLSAAKASLMSFQRARLRNGRSRHSSSSASGNSSKPSPGPISPPVLKSIESSTSSYFPKEMTMSEVKSRRESLSLGTSDLQLSDVSDDETRQGRISSPSSGSLPSGSNMEAGRHGVIRRPVTRRGNLLPKSKNFARIRAALLEEGAPIDFEAQREAEVIRQVRESEGDLPPLSPSLTSPVDTGPKPASATGKDITSLPTGQPSTDFNPQTSQESGGLGFLNPFESRYRTPPPGNQALGGVDDAMMQTPPSGLPIRSDISGSSAQMYGPQSAGPSRVEAEASRKSNKRRRDEMLDPNAFKRRAVSPGMSVQNSPVAFQSKTATSTPTSGKGGRGSESGSGSGSISGHMSGTMKRVGLQGMNETNDGLMNMSID
ncbi:hypothetical protein AJ79_02718 [Helicocarpus griseus UAMH5409]|uniref:Uncharacterized protein n=1 Tax=Helicocarpus griseus UAMH5409 TaxID=1447875 RepID=A0A2B7Y0P2_9EURO|nr:hypothetical protein AJ79_02718 [Helicocarpus griseus UAMH5409]